MKVSYRSNAAGLVARVADFPDLIRPPIPAAGEPGTRSETRDALDVFWSNPARFVDRDQSWQLALRLTHAHKRRAA